MKYPIRLLTDQDQDLIQHMLYLAIHVEEGQPPPDKDITDLAQLAKYFKGFGNLTDYGYAATEPETGRVVGALWMRLLTHDQMGYGYIDDTIPELSMSVEPEYRGQGIGSALLDYALEDTFYRYNTISLSVHPDNPAVYLYERKGFRVCGQSGDSLIMRVDR